MWLFEAVSCERELIMISTSNLTWQRTLFFFCFRRFWRGKSQQRSREPAEVSFTGQKTKRWKKKLMNINNIINK